MPFSIASNVPSSWRNTMAASRTRWARSKLRASFRLKISCLRSLIFKLHRHHLLWDWNTERERNDMRYANIRAAALLGSYLAITVVAQTQTAPTKQTVPAGTRILIRMVDSVDSNQ